MAGVCRDESFAASSFHSVTAWVLLADVTTRTRVCHCWCSKNCYAHIVLRIWGQTLWLAFSTYVSLPIIFINNCWISSSSISPLFCQQTAKNDGMSLMFIHIRIGFSMVVSCCNDFHHVFGWTWTIDLVFMELFSRSASCRWWQLIKKLHLLCGSSLRGARSPRLPAASGMESARWKDVSGVVVWSSHIDGLWSEQGRTH